MAANSQSLTLTSKGGLLSVLISDCEVGQAFSPASLPRDQWPALHPFKAIWDTGATSSVITQQVVDACGLKPTGMTLVNHAQGTATAETFVVNIRLPNQVGFANVAVTKGDLTGADALIGMDIITRGDFAVTSLNGRTVMSFRVPSIVCLDFVQEHNRAQKFKKFSSGGMSGGHAKGRRHKR